MRTPIKVIDLFAGPGGLGEGFSAFRSPDNKQAFKIAISIEKEASAHRTLLLRSFFRQYDKEDVPEEYYAFLRGELGKNPEDKLYHLPEVKEALEEASHEAQKLTLGEEDPRTVYGKIRNVLGKDECILIGGPPCQAYSLVGRSRNYGAKDKEYSATEDHRNFLYLEYLKIISKFQPKIFVMENVKGMLSARIDGELIFESILEDLQDPYKTTGVAPDNGREKHRYKIYSFTKISSTLDLIDGENKALDPHDYIIRAEEYGIPQARHRVILLGIREDIASGLDDFKRLYSTDDQVTVKQVISDLPKLRSRLSKGEDSVQGWRDSITNIDKKTLSSLSKDKHAPPEVLEAFSKNLEKIKNSPVSTGEDKGGKTRSSFNKKLTRDLAEWYKDPLLEKHVINHESRGHIVGDLHRYLYYSTFASVMKVSPKATNLPKTLWPNHKNFETGKFSDRFRVQLQGAPGTTVTSHISKDGHYFIHYDPVQCRSLTVREAARIQTFPDNYYFVGNRTQQYVQVGNAVPPFLASKIAEVVYSMLNK